MVGGPKCFEWRPGRVGVRPGIRRCWYHIRYIPGKRPCRPRRARAARARSPTR